MDKWSCNGDDQQWFRNEKKETRVFPMESHLVYRVW